MIRIFALAVLIGLALGFAGSATAQRPGDGQAPRFQVDPWWPRPPVKLYPAEMAVAVRRLRDMAVTARRDPATFAISFKGPLRFHDGAGRDRTPLTGSAAQIAEDLSAYAAAGVEHFVLDFSVGSVPEMLDVLERTMADVKPRVRG